MKVAGLVFLGFVIEEMSYRLHSKNFAFTCQNCRRYWPDELFMSFRRSLS
jgi:hypothetical protein